MTDNQFSGNFAPAVGESQKGTNEFTVPLNSYDAKSQVVGEEGSTRLYMPGRLRKYIPTLYKQVWLNSRAILSVNGYELVDNKATGQTDVNGNAIAATSVTSDLRTSVLSSAGGDFEAVTNVLKPEEVGMTKVVISAGPNADGTARTLKAVAGSKFMVHDGEVYDTYTFTEIGGHITYVQGAAPEDAEHDVVYFVLDYEGFFMNTSEQASTNQVADLDPSAPAAPAAPAAN